MIVAETLEPRPARVHAFDTARGCAVVLVVFMHVTERLQLEAPLSAGLTLFNWSAASIRMPLLFMLSGVLANGYLTRGLQDVGRRSTHFVWLLFVWGVVATMVSLIGSPAPAAFSSQIRSILLPDSPLWFIWALAMFTAVIPFVARRPRAQIVGIALVISCLSYLPSIRDMLPDVPVLKTARHGVYFYVGLTYARSIVDFTVGRSARSIALLVGATLVLHAANGITDRWLHLSLLLIPEKFTLSILALALAASLPQTRLALGLQWLGRNTLPIFLGHMLFVDYLVRWPIGIGQLERSAVITLCSVIASLGLKKCIDSAGLGWMYRMPTAIATSGAFTAPDGHRTRKIPGILARARDAI
ncbi:acyltransferase [Sphingomonas sp. A2-49]|uniref:acyltransferase family protein n=1 Tax=Sphingomonas sp. A2-49 TaxID=1391375 RepID=UPI0021D25D4B|nr:acyltransferase [Sphingomonas sp. A2-49]MCU6453178.1 acyltransferase [Sphingomonas sp. A2-49]